MQFKTLSLLALAAVASAANNEVEKRQTVDP